MKRKSTLVDSVSAEPEVSAVGRKRQFSPSNGANSAIGKKLSIVHYPLSIVTALLILCCLLVGGKAWGQQSIPYSYGFENNNLATDGWVQTTSNSSSGIYNYDAHGGSYLFRFNYNENPGYLRSPQLTGTGGGVHVSFWYKNYNSYYTEQFQVGYTTANNTDPSTYTYGSTIYGTNDWSQFEGDFPTGTKYIAIKYIYTDGHYLYLDDFDFALPSSCPKPTALSVTSTTATSATLSWTPSGSETVWQYSINDGSWTNLAGVTGTTTKTATITGLTASTAYTVKIRANCGGGDFSDPTGNVSFATACTALTISALPYTQGFESETCPANCWTLVYGDGIGTTNPMIHDDSYHNSGSRSFRFSSYSSGSDYNQYLISPEIDVASALDVTFHYANYGGSDNLFFGYSTTDASISSFTWTEALENSGSQSNWLEYEQGLPAGTRYIAFHYYGDYAYYVNLDDVTIGLLSSCLKPTALTFVSATTTTATISWTPGGSETAWQYTLDDGANWNNFASAPTGTTTKTGTITGLSAGSSYTVKVRAYCDANDQSAWSNTVTFTTEASACPKPTNVHAGNLTQHTAQITWDGNADSYTVRYRTATITGTTLDPVFEDGFESGLTGWTTYANDYDADGYTNWQTFDASQFSGGSNHSGSYSAMSRSWTSTTGDQSVDNWLVTPQMTLGNTLKFWVKTNAGFEDSYAVYVSIGSGVVPSSGTGDFEVIASLTPATGTWVEQTYDLSAYAGQSGYVAIRHKDYAHDHLLIDDFGVYNTINSYSYGTAYTITPATSPCNITGLNAETLYEVSVQSDCGDPDGISGWSSIYFTTPDACSAPTDLVSSSITTSTATLGWADNQDSYNLRYRKVYFYEDFEGETLPTGWTTIDSNNDGNTWYIGYATAHSGSNGACNLSYVYNTSGTEPDDYLVSPLLDLQGTLRVWLSGNNEYRYQEHFEILLSTTGNSAGDFSNTLVVETTTGNAYVEYTADLSSYAGQQGYIAIRHFNCTDQNYLYVDDFGLYGSENWVSVSPNPTDATASLTNLSVATEYECQVQGINCDGVGGTTSWSATSNFTTLYPTKIRNTNPAADEMTWNQFVGFVNGGYSYAGQTVTLMEDISVSDMVGTSSHPFRGTFEGDGKTITANISSSEQGAAPFRYISGATIQNLKVDGTVTSTAHHASGLVGFCADGSTNTIQNCLVSTNVTNSNAYDGDNGNNFIGGIIGHNMSATTSIIGCVYDGTITSQGFKGGMVGFGNYDSNVTITDSYFAGAYSANGYSDPNFSPISCHGAGRNFIFTFSNFYYNTDAGDFTASSYEGTVDATYNGSGRAKHAYSVTGESPVTVAMNGTPTTYNVSGITAYSTGIVYDGTIYGGSGDVLALSLSGSSCGYETDYGTLSGSGNPYSLTMEAYNTVISAPVYTVTVNVNADEGGTASGSGSYICGATATLEATANTGYHFVNWTKNSTEVSTSATYNFTVTEAADYVANFEINTYTVTTVIHPTEGGSAEGAGTYTHGSSCTLEATANTGYQFVNWTASNGSVVLANRSYTFTVTGDVTYQANFTKTTVTSLPWTENFDNGYSCANGWTYLHGEWATPLRWTKAACVTYYSWGAYSDPYCMELRANNSDNLVVLPQFDEPLNKLKIKFQIGRGNEASGYTVQLGYVTDPSDASTFTALDNIATPSSGVNHFDLYTYDLSTNNNSPSSSAYRLAIKYTKSGEDSWYLDDFDVRRVYTIAVSDNPSSTASSLTGAGKYDHGATCTVTATAGDCYNFVNWTENGTEVSTSASYSFTATADRNLVANFEEWTLSIDNTPSSLECINSGTEVVLTATATSDATPTYAWEVSSGSTAGTASGYTYTVSPTALSNTYTVSATIGGCERTQTATVTTKPVITSVSSSAGTEFCLGVSTDLSVVSNASSFTWDNDAGSGSPVTVTPTATKTYKVSATSGSCVSTSSITITVNTPDITDYDYIWRGVSDDWNTAENWYMYSEGNYSVALALPSETKNYYIGTGDCLPSSQWPSLSADATIGNVTIDGGSVTVPDGVTLSIAGTISGALTAESGSTIEFVGSSDQTINDSQTFSNVTFNKDGANVITATGGLTVNGTATFTSGIVTGNVTFGSGATVSGASTSSYVNGKVTRNGMSGAFTFPTGTATLYAPFKATSSSASNVSVQYAAGHDGMPDWWNHSGNLYDAGLNHASDRENWQLSASASTELSSIILYWNESDNHSFEEGNEALNSYLNVAAVKRNGFNWQNLGRASIEGDYDGSGSITAAEPLVIEISGAKAAGEGDYFVTFASSNNNLVLPIELTSFTATCDGRSALIEWTTATEKNNDYFSLERSDDAINFVEVARVAGAGNSIEPIDYAYNDYGIHGGDNYYRLVQVDYDGTRTVSEVIVANCIEPESDGEPEVLAYPNPFNSELTVVLDNFGNRAATIEVYDMLGKLIYTNKIASPQNSYETILNLSNLSPAAYTVRVSTTDFVINRNVVKQ